MITMNIKKIKIISVFFILGLTILFHFLYDWWPNVIFSTLFPVNESIWEHMKLLYFGIIIYGIVEYFIMKKLNLVFNNFLLNLFITSYSSIIIYLVIFLPIYNIIGENMIVSISLLVVVIILESIISYYILNYRNLGSIYNIISVVMLIIGYIGFVYLTYKPIRNYIFYDKLENKYGIDIYVLDE